MAYTRSLLRYEWVQDPRLLSSTRTVPLQLYRVARGKCTTWTAVERTVALSSSPRKLSWRCLRQYVQHHCLAWWRFQFWSRCIQAELLETTRKLLQVIDRRLSVSTAGEPVCSTKGHVIDAWILRFQRRSRPCCCKQPCNGPCSREAAKC